MQSLWQDDEAQSFIETYKAQGVNEDLALRVYTTRLLGGEPRLVLHGGGNTSVKTQLTDLYGKKVEALCVKGSGWDMGVIEPAGLPAVRLQPLQALEALDSLSDEDMVNAQRCNLMDSTSPNPSVETLLHAFLPHKYIDHTHSNAILSLTDTPNGEALCQSLFGERLAIVPYIQAGFKLAKVAAEIQRANPKAEGLILMRHGIFTFGEDARSAYERMIDCVTLAETHIAQKAAGQKPRSMTPVTLPETKADIADILPSLRGFLTAKDQSGDADCKRLILKCRTSPAILDFVNGQECARYAQQGCVTPDHTIRIKLLPCLLPALDGQDIPGFLDQAEKAIEDYKAAYQRYFEDNNARFGGVKTMLDPSPRVLLIPGFGLIAAGKSAKAATIAADVAESMVEVITGAETVDRFETISPADAFEMEYWSLEQAKLGKAKEPALARHVCVITGGAGAIGYATAAAFMAQGCDVAVLDVDGERAAASAKSLGAAACGFACDVTDKASVEKAIKAVIAHFGGIDILVSNAGAAWQGKIGEVSDEVLQKSFALNFWGHHYMAQAAVAAMTAQKTGGMLLFNTSKQAVNPGPNFGPYGLPKAATLFLSRQYAIDYGDQGITSNAVNADRIRSGLLTEDMIASRSTARGLSENDYMCGNLLKREVTADDVAEAFVHLALSRKSTGAVLTVDGGNIAAALR